MLIDWFTVGAQALNFLILVWLLKHFLYKPILNTIENRENRISKELADTAQKQAEAEKAQEEFQKKNKDFDQQRADLLNKAKDEVKVERDNLLAKARQEIEVSTKERQESLIKESQEFSRALRLHTQQEVFAIARKTLTDLATKNLETCIGDVFIQRLREMDSETKDLLGKALKTQSVPAILSSTFSVSEQQQGLIQKALNETFSMEIHIQFEVKSELIAGIEFTTNDQKLSWSISNYLNDMEKNIQNLLTTKNESKPSQSKVANR